MDTLTPEPAMGDEEELGEQCEEEDEYVSIMDNGNTVTQDEEGCLRLNNKGLAASEIQRFPDGG